MNLLFAFLHRDVAIERTYRFQLVIKGCATLFQLAIFYYLAKFIVRQEYFAFVFVGLLFSRFFQFWLNVFNEEIRQEQYWGTAELIFLSPRTNFSVVAAAAGSKLVLLSVELLVFLLLGIFVFGAPLLFHPAVFLYLFLQSAVFAGLGLAAGSFIMYFKRGDPVNWLIASSFDLLSGVYFPLSVLPENIRLISKLLPTTPALAAWRDILLNGQLPSTEALLVQAAWAVVFTVLGFLSFRRAVYLVKMKGELGSY